MGEKHAQLVYHTQMGKGNEEYAATGRGVVVNNQQTDFGYNCEACGVTCSGSESLEQHM